MKVRRIKTSKLMEFRLILIATLALVGCVSRPASWPEQTDAPVQSSVPIPTPSPPPSYKIQVVSDPPGAHIEVRGDYLGDAPYTLNVDGWPGCDRQFENALTITALPNGDGYVQTKCFRQNDPIPERVIFVMGLHNVRPDINLNVTQ